MRTGSMWAVAAYGTLAKQKRVCVEQLTKYQGDTWLQLKNCPTVAGSRILRECDSVTPPGREYRLLLLGEGTVSGLRASGTAKVACFGRVQYTDMDAADGVLVGHRDAEKGAVLGGCVRITSRQETTVANCRAKPRETKDSTVIEFNGVRPSFISAKANKSCKVGPAGRSAGSVHVILPQPTPTTGACSRTSCCAAVRRFSARVLATEHV